MYIYIMRHGETYWNREGKIQGASDIELTDYGIELAQITAEGFYQDGIRFDRIYSSPLIRALKTAQIVADKTLVPGGELILDNRLREMSFGKYEGLLLKEYRQFDENIANCFDAPERYVADETGESYEQVFRRIDDFTDRELLPLENIPEIQNVLVICHGTVIRAFLHRIEGFSLDDFWKIKQPNCCINKVELKDGVQSVVQKNILYYESEDLQNRGIL